jgi:protein-tyrosine phosphatase
MRYQILMVCMGNICRSPTAQAVLQAKIQDLGLDKKVAVQSAGTQNWHQGSPPDSRSIHHAALRGYDLAPLRAKAIRAADFETCDLILAMDQTNFDTLQEQCPVHHDHKLQLLMTYSMRYAGIHRSVPDPYYGGPNGFEHVLDLIENACDGVTAKLTEHLDSRNVVNF